MTEQRGVSVARIALTWLLARQSVSSVIVGARTIEQLEDNLGAADVVLSAEELDTLDQVSMLPEEYPAWMLERQKQYRAELPERKG
jgi:aryl-alcohol dehydrogenase-like predicted oxidoreductase